MLFDDVYIDRTRRMPSLEDLLREMAEQEAIEASDKNKPDVNGTSGEPSAEDILQEAGDNNNHLFPIHPFILTTTGLSMLYLHITVMPYWWDQSNVSKPDLPNLT